MTWTSCGTAPDSGTKIQGKSLTVRGLNALAAVASTPLAAPVITATRLRGGAANSARGAASLAAEAISVARQAGYTGQIVVGIDSAYYSAAVLGAIRAAGACFSVTVRMDPKIRAAIAVIGEDAWTPITWPRAICDEDQNRLISDAEVAEVPYTAFAARKGKAITAPPDVRRVKDLNRKASQGQDELFAIWRYHALFTDSPFEMIQAEAPHRDHAIVEQVFADLTSGPLAHLPSGHSPANAAWLALAAMNRGILPHLRTQAQNRGKCATLWVQVPLRTPAGRPDVTAVDSARTHQVALDSWPSSQSACSRSSFLIRCAAWSVIRETGADTTSAAAGSSCGPRTATAIEATPSSLSSRFTAHPASRTFRSSASSPAREVMDRLVSFGSAAGSANMAASSASGSSASSALPDAVQFAASTEPVREATRSARELSMASR